MTAIPALNETLGQQRVVSNGEGRAVIEYLAGLHMWHSGGVVQGGAAGSTRPWRMRR